MNKADETLKEMLAAMVVYGVAAQIICFIIHYDMVRVSVGLWVGIIVAAGMAIHMNRSLDEALDLDEAGALGHIRKTYLVRVTVAFIILGAVVYFQIGNMFAAFAGLMSLKLSAYMQPAMHKLMKFKNSK